MRHLPCPRLISIGILLGVSTRARFISSFHAISPYSFIKLWLVVLVLLVFIRVINPLTQNTQSHTQDHALVELSREGAVGCVPADRQSEQSASRRSLPAYLFECVRGRFEPQGLATKSGEDRKGLGVGHQLASRQWPFAVAELFPQSDSLRFELGAFEKEVLSRVRPTTRALVSVGKSK